MNDHARPTPRRRIRPGHARPDISGIDIDALRAALEETVEGEVRFDAQARALYATDASNYREVPIGVVTPKSDEDVVRTVAACRRFGAPVLARGGGTSLAGQCCNVAVVIDFTKHLHRVLGIDAEARTAWVEPGCVLDDLRAAANEHGLTFGPDPSTHNHCTLGGMAGNNSCGVHSVMAGRTADNIEALEILTYDGERMTVGPTDDEAIEQIISAGGRRGEIYAGLKALRDGQADRIRARYPKIPRRVSGYNLDELLPENGFHVARALVGSEGTCVTILRIKCRLVPNPSERVLLVLGFRDVYAAGDAVPRVLSAGPIGLEGMDDELTKFMRARHFREEDLKLLPEGAGWLLAEFGADDRAEAEAQARRLMEALRDGDEAPHMRLLVDADEQKPLWAVRKAGLPATVHAPGHGETYPGWEDAGIPPESVGDYLRDFRKLLDEFGYECSIYGHFGDGCLHCRIAFDLATEQGRETYGRFIDRAADLVIAYGGSLSGEHGDGQARGALLGKMFGPELVAAFRDFKAIWDPDWKMNPGKVVLPDGPLENLRDPPARRAWEHDIHLSVGTDGRDFVGFAGRCVGVGECRKHGEGIMCPSYMATMDETYSTRGRSRLLYEMTEGEIICDGWRSEAVRDALDLCLACKGCKSECPVTVDMASYKAEFMHHHYKGRLRPRSAYSMGLIWWWARLGSVAPGVTNFLGQTPPFADIGKWAGGIAPERQIPRFARPDFRTWFGRRGTRGAGERGRVMLWPDTFNTYLTAEPLKAAVTLLEDAGWRVEIPGRPVCCGRPLYAAGFLGLADRLWRRTLHVLRPAVEAGVPVVGLEPTCVAAFRDELLEMRPDDPGAKALSGQTFHLSEFLMREGYEPPRREGRALVHGHCHHHAVLGADAEVEVLKRAGLEVDLLDAGCCGMAGDFGFRRETYDVAMKVGERAFLSRVRDAAEALFVADGFSCREQALQATGRRLPTLPEVLVGTHRPDA